MTPGRELDALVAERVMGHKVASIPSATYETCYYLTEVSADNSVPKYSTDISVAWEVMEKFKSHEHYSGWHVTDDSNSSIACWADFTGEWFAGVCIGRGIECAGGVSIPHAICLAALKAIEVKT